MPWQANIIPGCWLPYRGKVIPSGMFSHNLRVIIKQTAEAVVSDSIGAETRHSGSNTSEKRTVQAGNLKKPITIVSTHSQPLLKQ